MTILVFGLATIAPATTLAAASSPTCGNESPARLAGAGPWACTFDDEFDASTGDASALNRSSWTPMVTADSGYTTGPTSDPVCYIDSPDTVSVSGGALHLTISALPNATSCDGLFTTRYIGGMVTSVGNFDQTYGRFEVSALLPQTTAKGLQETLWLYPQNLTYGPWPGSGEVDFSEFYSEYSSLDIPYIHYNYASSTAAPGSDTNKTTADCPISLSQYNNYAVTWEPGSFTVTVNGATCLIDDYQADGGLSGAEPFDQPFFIALTQALGIGTNAFDPNTTPLPATTSVRYVRVWGSTPVGTAATPAAPAATPAGPTAKAASKIGTAAAKVRRRRRAATTAHRRRARRRHGSRRRAGSARPSRG
ncbi:MAG TPA: glycoside hydrolase family 16 protein [Solirubrobacteraceae bacterium]|nr:glycoside hydrolase family 16 protein [Solirubrobacteraceae bacterium]